jgi:hypothetical protein
MVTWVTVQDRIGLSDGKLPPFVLNLCSAEPLDCFPEGDIFASHSRPFSSQSTQENSFEPLWRTVRRDADSHTILEEVCVTADAGNLVGNRKGNNN